MLVNVEKKFDNLLTYDYSITHCESALKRVSLAYEKHPNFNFLTILEVTKLLMS